MNQVLAKRAGVTVCVLGAVFILAGLYIVLHELETPGTVAAGRGRYFYAGIGLLVAGSWMLAPLTTEKIMARVGTYLPVLGGNRPADLDASERVTLPANKLPPDQQAQAAAEEILGPSSLRPENNGTPEEGP